MLRELAVPFLIGTLAVVLMFQANLLIFEFKNISIQHVPMAALGQLVLYKTPFYLNMTFPVGTSLAAALAVSRITRESELTAMRSAGASIRRVVAPVIAFGFGVALLNYANAEYVMPPAEKAFKTVALKVGLLSTIPDFTSNAVVKLQRATLVIGAATRSGGGVDLADILMVERPRHAEITLITAERGTYRDGIWTLRSARMVGLSGLDLVVAQPRGDVLLNEKIAIQDMFLPPMPEEQTAAELRHAIDTSRKLGANVDALEVAYHVRASVPVACLVFALTAPVFAVLFSRSGAFVGVLLSIILVFLYYNVFVISTQILGHAGFMTPVVAAWLPDVLFAALGLAALRRLE